MGRRHDWVPVGEVDLDDGWIKPGAVKEGFETANAEYRSGYTAAMPFTTQQGRDHKQCVRMLDHQRQCKGRKVEGEDICASHLRALRLQEKVIAEMVDADGDGS